VDDIVEKVLRGKLTAEHYDRLMSLANARLHRFVADAIELCTPGSVFICADRAEDIRYIREQAVARGEERPLATAGHTVHFDGVQDQGRDREVTRYLVPREDSLGKALNQIEREEGLAEVRGLLAGAMRGRTMIVRCLSLGPADSAFAIPCVQCTDSFYVAHSEDLLYRTAYERFKHLAPDTDLFCFLHSAGRLNGDMVSSEADKKRIYIDYRENTIYSVNTQYAGNTVGLKKLALRLAVRKADREGWLAEHMFLMAVHGPGGRKTYFAGAFPSACGKTCTAMLSGETILGDDIAYFRNVGGRARAVNTESGIFGIIQTVNPKDDPTIYRALTTPGEVIFSNVLVKDGRPYWLGMGSDLPKDGLNFSGQWYEGKTNGDGSLIPPAHKNARYSISLAALANCDPELNNPEGVPVGGIVYGGRDADAYVPIQQSFDWEHGIIAYGAWLETETTFAILGKEGVSEINLMSIQDFVSIPLGKYIRNNLEFGARLQQPPLVFGVNYFLRDREGKFVNQVRDKAVWVKWMELRVHGDVGAARSATGWVPRYEDLQALFRQVLASDYPLEDYVKQFTLRLPENLAKLQRVEKFYQEEVSDAPPALFQVLEEQRRRLLFARSAAGDYVSPLDLAKMRIP
jgi:phosphoenolpyruvate carboxykinase (GTP)